MGDDDFAAYYPEEEWRYPHLPGDALQPHMRCAPLLEAFVPGLIRDGIAVSRQGRIVTTGAHIVVTGCAGFIGSHLADRLLADGRTVVGVDSFIHVQVRVPRLSVADGQLRLLLEPR